MPTKKETTATTETAQEKREKAKALKAKLLKETKELYGDLSVPELQEKHKGLGLLIDYKKKENAEGHSQALGLLIQSYAASHGLTFREAKQLVGKMSEAKLKAADEKSSK